MLKRLFALLICVFVVGCSTKVSLLTGKYTLLPPVIETSEIKFKNNGHFIRTTHFFESRHKGKLKGTWVIKNDTLLIDYNNPLLYNDTFKIEPGQKEFCSFTRLTCYKKN